MILQRAGMGMIDFLCFHAFRRPLFCTAGETADDGGSGRYVGLGYAFDMEEDFMPEDLNPGVTTYISYLFGVAVASGPWDG